MMACALLRCEPDTLFALDDKENTAVLPADFKDLEMLSSSVFDRRLDPGGQ
jgi:hypothetical protein